MNELGLVRVTEDIDLLIDGSVENQQLVRVALRILPERAIDELGPDEDLREWVVVRVNDEITVDLMIRLKQGNREKDRIDLEYLLRSGDIAS